MKRGTKSDLSLLEDLASRPSVTSSDILTLAFQRKLIGAQSLDVGTWREVVDTQLAMTLDHAADAVPRYQFLRNIDRSSIARSREAFRAIVPTTSRQGYQLDPESFQASKLPDGHRRVGLNRSSGTTGNPIEVSTTNVFAMWQQALVLRANIWAKRDFSKDLAVVRKLHADQDPGGESRPHWANRETFPFDTGRCHLLDAASNSLEQQYNWLAAHQAPYLMTFPSILSGLLRLSQKDSARWRPTGVMTFGETLSLDLRKAVSQAWGVGLDDTYSAEECGVIALQCPEHGNYHVQSENVLVELIDKQGRNCRSGEIGRVVITTLNNFATPLIRYEIGDWAEKGGLCKCGRVGQTLKRIVGRSRHLLKTSSGDYWPSFGFRKLRNKYEINSYQVRQKALDRVEFAFTADHELDEASLTAIQAHLSQVLPKGVQASLRQVGEIVRPESGKLEVFICEIPD